MTTRAPSARRDELLERAYRYVTAHGLAELSLRPLAAAVESSPRVLLFLFDSKEGLVRALLARARQDELAFLERGRAEHDGQGLSVGVRVMWRWLSAEEHRPLLGLWAEAYALSLVQPDGPWAGFGRQTVDDWLDVLAATQPADRRDTEAGSAERTLALAVLRGALLDLLATGDVDRTTAAVERYAAH
ncbi:TetR/AcrR family transcriptional regulator [Cryptosporangium phraense]|uniref:TetR/AcrR family transcriptional regulator n=1 Tax=Cryptosporangium phraense TaxID=2593070 RepID=A0A545AVA2_9ACTN|nr:TetR/AcrR family transcriptional regulator [Cryptosporangium phraense]TQS45262.1 TetR/AcrR family transcriptional regulator [Cryptosporangium phraense]